MGKLLIVDDDAETLELLTNSLVVAGHRAVACGSAERAVEEMRSQHFDVVIWGVRDTPGFLETAKAIGLTSAVILLAAHRPDLEIAIRSNRAGVADFVEKPVSADVLLTAVENCLRISFLEDENRRLRQQLGRHELVWQSTAMEKVIARLDRAADAEVRKCIFGEMGTEKELLARAIHDRSAHQRGPFVAVNCGALAPEAIEVDLFGDENAAGKPPGKFEQASGGTLFLDDIHELSYRVQPKLLGVLESGTIHRNRVQVICATQVNLEHLVKRKVFLEGLYHQLLAFPLIIPPLRERIDDIPVLTDYFASIVTRQNDWKPKVISAAAYGLLQSYSWPGNVRELRNVVERLLLLANSEVDAATVRHVLGLDINGMQPVPAPDTGGLFKQLETVERGIIVAELQRNDFRMSETARVLGLERSHLYKKCQHLGINHRSRTPTKSLPLKKGTDAD